MIVHGRAIARKRPRWWGVGHKKNKTHLNRNGPSTLKGCTLKVQLYKTRPAASQSLRGGVTAARTCPRGRSRPTRTAAPAPEADPVHEHGHGSRTNQARARRERRTNASEARRRPPARNALGTQACEVAPESSRRRGAGARARGARAATCRQWARAMQGEVAAAGRWLEFLAGLELAEMQV